MKKNFEQFRPVEYKGKGEAYLYPLIKELAENITKLQEHFIEEALLLGETNVYILSHLLVEFAEDLHNDIGLWSSIESYNIDMFGTPLPLFIKSKEEITECFDINRFRFFIYNIFELFDVETMLSPSHRDLTLLAEEVAAYLKVKFATIPKDSGINKLLQKPDEFAWDVKRKLVWIALNSYLFRYNFLEYVNTHNNGKTEIPVIEDFICQENTGWSGLGVLDIVAGALDLPESKRNDVRSWYERLTSFYKVVASEKNRLSLENIVNNQLYHVHIDYDHKVFKTGHIFMGSLVPYGNYYYWSGLQNGLGKVGTDYINTLKKDIVKNASAIVYRYDKTLLAKAQNDIKTHYNDFKAFFKDDLVIYRDGKTLAAALQKKDRQKYEEMPKEELKKFMKKNNLKNPYPALNLPQHILEKEDGIGVYFNPDEGMEMMTIFNDVKSAFGKKGIKLNQDEKEAIRELIISGQISVNFVKRLIGQYGSESIAATFFIENEESSIYFLLHKYKGHFYRNRYPQLSYIN